VRRCGLRESQTRRAYWSGGCQLPQQHRAAALLSEFGNHRVTPTAGYPQLSNSSPMNPRVLENQLESEPLVDNDKVEQHGPGVAHSRSMLPYFIEWVSGVYGTASVQFFFFFHASNNSFQRVGICKRPCPFPRVYAMMQPVMIHKT
jgi:hypothetical protein